LRASCSGMRNCSWSYGEAAIRSMCCSAHCWRSLATDR